MFFYGFAKLRSNYDTILWVQIENYDQTTTELRRVFLLKETVFTYIASFPFIRCLCICCLLLHVCCMCHVRFGKCIYNIYIYFFYRSVFIYIYISLSLSQQASVVWSVENPKPHKGLRWEISREQTQFTGGRRPLCFLFSFWAPFATHDTAKSPSLRFQQGTRERPHVLGCLALGFECP